MKRTCTILLLAALLLLAGCRASQLFTAQSAGLPPQACPVTVQPDDPFIPPDPWPATSPDPGRFWYGNPELWTALPLSGSWPQLANGDKFWLWSEQFDVHQDETPDFTVTAERLDAAAPTFRSDETTNGYHESWHWAMLTGVELPSPGCWQFEVTYKGHQLEFVVQVPEQ